MTTPSIHTLLLLGALLPALLPAQRAADGHFQKEGPQSDPIIAVGQSPLSRSIGIKKIPEDVAVRQAYSRRAQLSTPRPSPSGQNNRARRMSTALNVQEIIIETSPGAPYTIISSYADERLMVEFLPLPRRLVVLPIQPAHTTPRAIMHAPFISAALGEGVPVPLVENVTATLPPLPPPAYASPVPGKPGCVYPPGGLRIPANIVDVTGLESGTRARDPITNVIFLVP